MTSDLTWAELRNPLETLAISYQRKAERAQLDLLLQLDRRLGRIVLGAKEQVLAQIKLAWWRDAMTGGSDQPKGDPLVRALLKEGLAGQAGSLVDGWEELLVADKWTEPVIGQSSLARGVAIDAGRACPAAAARWAAWDLALHTADVERSNALWRWAATQTSTERWPRELRGSAILAGLAAHELHASPVPRHPAGFGSWVRTLRLGLTGR